MRAAIYTRISADQTGEGLGVARQLEDCLELAAQLGWDVVAPIYSDNDLSAFSGRTRPGFEALLKAMENREFTGLLVWHVDRLYRQLRDLERLIPLADGLTIKAVNSGELDLSNSTGKMVARILGSVAQQESEHKGERQKRANVQKAAAGTWQTANRCFGYTMAGEPLEPEATAIRTAVTDVLAGKSINQIAREWNAAGFMTTLAGTTQTNNGKTRTVSGKWNSARVRRLLMNPRHAALRTLRGKVVGPGDWPALIDPDTHRGLVAFLSDPSRIKCTSYEKKYMGSGVYLCGVCGAKMRHTVPGGKRPGGRRYECSGDGGQPTPQDSSGTKQRHVVRSGPALDELVEGVVLGVLGRSRIHSCIGDANTVDIDAMHAKRAALQARLDELASLFADGTIDGSQLTRGSGELRKQIAGVDGVLAEAARTSPVARLLNDAAGKPDALIRLWSEASADIRGKIVDELMTVRVMPVAARNGPRFDPAFIDIQPRD